MTKWTFLFLAFFLSTFTEVRSQSERLIVIENADSLVARVVDGESARELIGNVRFSQERVRISCDRAVQFQETGNVQLLGNVVVVDDSLTMKFPRGMYFREDRRAVAYDTVHLDDRSMTLSAHFGEYDIGPKKAFFRSKVVANDKESNLIADSLTYYRDDGRTIALGKVEIQSYADNLTIRGGHFESFKKQEYSRMTVFPVLVKYDTTASSGTIDTLIVRSRVMEAYRGGADKRLIATDSVEILRADMASIAGVAIFYTQDDSILLRRSPVIWYERTQVTGDSINVYLRRNKLDRVFVSGRSLAISQSDTLYPQKFDQITGEEMILHFGENGMERMEVNTRAISVYHVYEDSLANGLNKTSGDRIVMLWEEGKLSSIKVFGGVEGEYIPENLVHGRELEYAVAGFVWREDRPVRRESDFTFTTPNRQDIKKK
ncbi:MAG: hypothetical protein KF749_08450 [Bacteroidetes bacterium]|nr:hypothetical protein [Bacteroidota bacterium]MCW5895965.1 hypothetical protein [Bacteroidota bacterium]